MYIHTLVNFDAFQIETLSAGIWTRLEEASEANPGYTSGEITYTHVAGGVGVTSRAFWEVGNGSGFITKQSTSMGSSLVRASIETADIILGAGVVTPVVFNNIFIDTQSEFNTITGVFTAKQSGYYQIYVNIQFSDAIDAKRYGAYIYVNGAERAAFIAHGSNTGYLDASVMEVLYLTAGNTVYTAAFQNSGGNATIPHSGGNGNTSQFIITKIQP
jgi:hypothetical protein